MLNKSWRNKPSIILVTGYLLADAIVVDRMEAIVVNGVKTYCRLPSVDVVIVDGTGAISVNDVKAYCQLPSVNAHFENTNGQEASFPLFSSQYPNRLLMHYANNDSSKD